MKTKFLKVKGDWQEVLNDCRATVGKEALDKDPSEKFIKQMLLNEHSPIRDITRKFMWENQPYWVAMHYKTHTWQSRVDSQRNDRQTKYDRRKAPQDSPVTFIGEMNIQNEIDTARKRLCFKASAETREYMEDYKITLHETDSFEADVLVPNCIYRCGCPEAEPCGFFTQFMAYIIATSEDEFDITDIQKRYDAYNELFYTEHIKEVE